MRRNCFSPFRVYAAYIGVESADRFQVCMMMTTPGMGSRHDYFAGFLRPYTTFKQI
jgi:hypothetical protein